MAMLRFGCVLIVAAVTFANWDEITRGTILAGN
jgi:hypothetical protein